MPYNENGVPLSDAKYSDFKPTSREGIFEVTTAYVNSFRYIANLSGIVTNQGKELIPTKYLWIKLTDDGGYCALKHSQTFQIKFDENGKEGERFENKSKNTVLAISIDE